MAGMEYRSDMLWELFIPKELERKELRFVTDLFRRVVAMPTMLYNKHWDNFIAHYHVQIILQDLGNLSVLRLSPLGFGAGGGWRVTRGVPGFAIPMAGPSQGWGRWSLSWRRAGLSQGTWWGWGWRRTVCRWSPRRC